MGTGDAGGAAPASARVRRRRILDGCRWAGLLFLLIAYAAPLYEVDAEHWAEATTRESKRGERPRATPAPGDPIEEEDAAYIPPRETTGFKDAWDSLEAPYREAPHIVHYPRDVPRRAPALLILPWFVATLRRRVQRGPRRLLRVVLALTTLAFAATIGAGAWAFVDFMRQYPRSSAIWQWPVFAILTSMAAIALSPPRRRFRYDPMPWAASAALACGLWVGLEVTLAIAAEPATALRPGGLPRAGVLVPPALLLFALPSYLPRRRRRDRLGAPALAAPAAGSGAA
jgi:hypothetical protein